MKIAYVARHGNHGNCDERAVAMALVSLGHEVIPVEERDGERLKRLAFDLLLFHKWRAPTDLLRSVRVPKVFWYWDLVSWPGDPSLADRNRTREHWMDQTVPLVDCGFLTDGDYVGRRGSKNLCWLPQGVDGFFAEGLRDVAVSPTHATDVLLTGIGKGGGRGRESFVSEMRQAYGSRFKHVRHGCHQVGLYREIQSAKVVVAPDSPVTDRYWSNRVYLALGYGGFLLHPFSKGVAQQYLDGHDLVFYHDRCDLHDKLAHYLEDGAWRPVIAEQGRATTLAEHTYRVRLIEMFKELHRRKVL